MSLWETNNIDFENDPTLKRIRQTWLKGEWPNECNICKIEENRGNTSRRQSSNMWLEQNTTGVNTDVELLRLDYWTGNTCNLRCATCGPRFSNSWEKELGVSKADRQTLVNDNWRSLELSKLRWIHFNGGEPLLIDHTEFLQAIPNKSLVHLNYNTNCTVRPTEELIQLWAQFKLVQLDFSIDGISERFEYIRYPAKWNVVENNLYWYKANMPVNTMFDINSTVSILNKACIDKTENWFKENFDNNRLGDKVKFRRQHAYGVLAIDGDKCRALKHLNDSDLRRKTNWKQTFPELIDYFSGV